MGTQQNLSTTRCHLVVCGTATRWEKGVSEKAVDYVCRARVLRETSAGMALSGNAECNAVANAYSSTVFIANTRFCWLLVRCSSAVTVG